MDSNNRTDYLESLASEIRDAGIFGHLSAEERERKRIARIRFIEQQRAAISHFDTWGE